MAIPPRMIPNVLEWKYPGVEGIETKRDDDIGVVDITGWPDGQGDKPTAAQLDSWYAEWRVADGDKRDPSIEERLDALENAAIKKNIITRAEIDDELPDDVKPHRARL